jgi:hypothetical protein
MALTHAQSTRNADARVVLQAFYAKRGKPSATVMWEFVRDDAIDGVPRDRLVEGAERLVRLGWAKRVGAAVYAINLEGVDAAESPDRLDAELTVLRDAPVVPPPEFRDVSKTVAAALSDAQAAIARGEPANAIDRVAARAVSGPCARRFGDSLRAQATCPRPSPGLAAMWLATAVAAHAPLPTRVAGGALARAHGSRAAHLLRHGALRAAARDRRKRNEDDREARGANALAALHLRPP